MKVQTNVKAGLTLDVTFKATQEVSVKGSAEGSVKFVFP